MPFTGTTVDVYAPAKEEGGDRDVDAVIDALEENSHSDVPIAASGNGYVEQIHVSNGKLEIGVWTSEGNAEGWYVWISIPLLPTKSLNRFLTELSDTLSNFSDRFKVEDVRTKEVDGSGRVSVGKQRAGEEVRVAVLED